MHYTTSLLALALLITITTRATAATEQFVCTHGLHLEIGVGAKVTSAKGGTVELPEPVFTGETLVFTPDGKSGSCDGQTVCVIGICSDTWCTFNVSIGNEVAQCLAPNTYDEAD